MVSLWYKIKTLNKRKRHTLHSLSVGFVFFGFLYILTKLFSVSLCPVKHFFNVNCFGCGMTRGFISILELDILSAFKYNVLSIPLFFGTLIYFILALLDIFTSKSFISRLEKFLLKKYMFVIYFIILIISSFLNNS